MQLTSVYVEQKEPSVWELKVEVAPEEVQRAMNFIYQQLNRALRVPGFRPGHIPPGIIKGWVGEEQINKQILEALLPDALREAILQHNLTPIVSPECRDVQFTEGQPLRFVAEVITRPEVQLGKYKGIELKRTKLPVTEEMLQQELERFWQELAKYEQTDEPAQDGDRVRVRYQVLHEGGGLKGKWQSGTFTAGLEDWTLPLPKELVGRKIGDEGEFIFTYPDDYQNPELSGKTVQVRFVVESVLQRHLPELTDEAVQQQVGLRSVEALKEDLRYELEVKQRREAREREREQAEDELLKCCSVTIPTALLERFVNESVAHAEHTLRREGLTLEFWLRQQGKSLDDYRNELRSEIERSLKLRFIIEAIAQEEGISIPDEEVQQLARDEVLDEERLSILRRQLLELRVMELVLATAKWVEEIEMR